ncbi:6-phosphogluconolactonase [Pararcticibacter amylolyticus]|uniref:6-phosphogluconolactonase n=1 Tax=Pararcticibacter amylolyticus TaxID=2173175 RepID=A0A2U2PKT3_9SPHI|nr:6-phosphogluconolactonase [Pararcticibacter amylolyticus]PWG82027.1 6-phosphogluconolactonase [Pararcticibacter amylolyticus]
MIKIFTDSKDLSAFAADYFTAAARKAIAEKGTFNVALTGGNSPLQLYTLLASPQYSGSIDWSKTYIFWGDERWVPLDDKRSNAGMAYAALLDHVPVNKDHVYPMWSDQLPPGEYAAVYEKLLRSHFDKSGGTFDLILLGMGEDGHTASLFPGTQVTREQHTWVKAYYLNPQQMYRITLTAPLINLADRIMVITFGENKSDALAHVLEGKRDTITYPAQLLQPEKGELIWAIDDKAAAALSPDYIKTNGI